MPVWEIVPGLAIADLAGAEEAERQGAVVINVTERPIGGRPHFPCYNPFDPQLRARLVEFIEGRLREGRRVVVHCEGAVDRSPDAVITYLMEKRAMSYEEAWRLVSSRKAVNRHPEWH